MSSSRREWGFWHEQHGQSVRYASNPYRPRQRVRRLVEWDGRMPTVAEIASTENLVGTFYDLKARAGQAPGPDRMLYADLGQREVFWVMRIGGE
jgi:hypothetical protein